MILPPTNWKEIKGPLTVSFVATMILFIAYTSQVFVIWPFLGPINLHSIFILVPLNLFVILVLINYFLTCKTDPGSVPTRWIPRQQAFIEVKKSTHTPRFCKTCDNYKPPRTHHCSVCKRCVLKMDHHCPWVNNCVGFANYCHFFRFLIYVDVSTVYLFVLLCCRLAQLVRDMRNFGIKPTVTEACFLSINLVLLLLVMITVGILTAYHVYCITTNTTTIEGWEKGRSLTIKGMGKIHNVKCPYDQGIYKNLQAVLGKWPIFWLLPSRMAGTGFDFPINTKRYLDDDEEATINNDKNIFSSSTSLNRRSTTRSAAVTSFGSFLEDDDEGGGEQWVVHDEKQHNKHVDITPLQPLKTKPSTNTIGSMMPPTTPASILTFASNATTLVDYKLPPASSSGGKSSPAHHQDESMSTTYR